MGDMKPAKIVQITSVQRDDDNITVYGLDEIGTLWRLDYDTWIYVVGSGGRA